MMDTSEDWLLWFINVFDKKSKGSGVTTLANKSAIKSVSQNRQLAEELHKSIVRKLKKEECTRHLKTIFGVPI